MGAIVVKCVVILSEIVLSFAVHFFSGVGSGEADDDEASEEAEGSAEAEADDSGSVVSRGGVFSDTASDSAADELPAPKKPFSLPDE